MNWEVGRKYQCLELGARGTEKHLAGDGQSHLWTQEGDYHYISGPDCVVNRNLSLALPRPRLQIWRDQRPLAFTSLSSAFFPGLVALCHEPAVFNRLSIHPDGFLKCFFSPVSRYETWSVGGAGATIQEKGFSCCLERAGLHWRGPAPAPGSCRAAVERHRMASDLSQHLPRGLCSGTQQ